MQSTKLKTFTPPKCISVYRGTSTLTLHQFISAVFYCQAGYVLDTQDPLYFDAVNRFIESYKKLARTVDYAPLLSLPSTLRVRTGKPVYANLEESLHLRIEISSFTPDLCSFDHDPVERSTTLVLNEDKLDCAVPSGLYHASIVIEAPPDMWVDKTGRRYLFDTSSSSTVHLLLMLNKYTGGLEKHKKKAHGAGETQAEHDGSLVSKINYYVKDFRKTFNF